MDAYAYIDGFNLYYGIKRWQDLKWLDIQALVDRLFPNDNVQLMRYFTANVKGKLVPEAPIRQQAYLRALTTLPRVQTHLGRFLVNPVWLPLEHPSNQNVPVLRSEEKGSDVNIATYLMLDAIQAGIQMAIVISNDSDLREPIRLVQQAPFNLVVWAVNPLRKFKTNMNATHHIDMKVADVRASQLPNAVVLANGKTVQRPAKWV